MRVVALDFGSARTGVAVSDATGTLARPVEVVEGAATDTGLERIAELVAAYDAELVVVGLPLTMRGERGTQALETEAVAQNVNLGTSDLVEAPTAFAEKRTPVFEGR